MVSSESYGIKIIDPHYQKEGKKGVFGCACTVQENMRRKCLVVGANGGLGRAITRRLTKEQYLVIATYHNTKEHLELYRNNEDVCLYYLDLLDQDNIQLTDDRFEGITDIIFAAGKESLKNILECRRNEMIEQYNIGIFSPLLIIQNIIHRYGSSLKNILFISSSAANDLKSANGVYALSKSCLCNLAKMLDSELKDRGIRVNCIVPGWCETEIAERISRAKGGTIEDIRAGKLENKLVQAEEIAEICMFLLSDSAKNVHGQFIGVDVPEKRL